ncbi:Tripeptidyl-peptidase II [Handroanthus impetiginosus]|uniref:Tripeptidyl-peptidase II n=1 Tax=Handroanthus impetiginosus TaxID=429701 RepID=A0A2G9I8S2_9LAMI|nr:Tripeptidyl-peptidase II [Handroanthus impetiginosus]
MEFHNPVALVLLLLFLLAHNAHSAKRSVYIVHMDKTFMPKAFSDHYFWYSSILKSSNSVVQTSPGEVDKTEPKLIYAYDNAFHGKSRNNRLLLHLRNFFSGPMNLTATGIWPASQYGKGVIIGVIDSGIWPESPSFNDDGMTEIPAKWKGICQEGQEFNSSLCNKKLIGARYFNAGFRAADPDFHITMNSARDTDGHGTHVASIAAGNFVNNVSFFGYSPGTARGVAPRAGLAVYKVLWESGGVGSDIIAGIDQAVADGVDIISVSIGVRAFDLYENPLSIASFGAREKGILVSVSAGNRGPSLRTIRSGIPWAVVVTSGTIDRWLAGTLTLGNGKIITGWSTYPARATVRNLPLVYNKTLSACNSTIIIAEDPSIFRSNSFPHPGVVITPMEAREVIDYASNGHEPRATIDFQETVIGTKPRAAPALSDSASRGPGRSYDGILKPDLLAPGVLILAAYNPQITGTRIGNKSLSTDYNILSGTSMACPHVSGTAALLKAAHPEWSPAAIQSAMMTTANPLDNTNQPIKDMAFNYRATTPLGVGSGLVDPNRALDPGLIYDASPQDLVNLVCSMNFTREQTQTIVRSNYNCSNPSSDLNYPSTFQRIVTNVGNGAAKYTFKLEVPENTTIRIRPQTLVFRKKYEKQRYSLTIRYRADIEFQHRPGSISWIEENGKYVVRSPIMVSAGADNFE